MATTIYTGTTQNPMTASGMIEDLPSQPLNKALINESRLNPRSDRLPTETCCRCSKIWSQISSCFSRSSRPGYANPPLQTEPITTITTSISIESLPSVLNIHPLLEGNKPTPTKCRLNARRDSPLIVLTPKQRQSLASSMTQANAAADPNVDDSNLTDQNQTPSNPLNQFSEEFII